MFVVAKADVAPPKIIRKPKTFRIFIVMLLFDLDILVISLSKYATHAKPFFDEILYSMNGEMRISNNYCQVPEED